MAGDERIVDVAIVGGGLSGLAAGLYLADHGVHNICLLEAQAALGGTHRAISVKRRDTGQMLLFDAGLSFVGPTQSQSLALLRRFSLKTRSVIQSGLNATRTENQEVITHPGPIPPPGMVTSLSLMSVCSIVEALQTIDKLAGTVPSRYWKHHKRPLLPAKLRDSAEQGPDFETNPNGKQSSSISALAGKPSISPAPRSGHVHTSDQANARASAAKELNPHREVLEADQVSVAEWLARTAATSQAADTLSAWVRGATCAAPAEISQLHLLRLVNRSGSVHRLLEVEGGHRDRFVTVPTTPLTPASSPAAGIRQSPRRSSELDPTPLNHAGMHTLATRMARCISDKCSTLEAVEGVPDTAWMRSTTSPSSSSSPPCSTACAAGVIETGFDVVTIDWARSAAPDLLRKRRQSRRERRLAKRAEREGWGGALGSGNSHENGSVGTSAASEAGSDSSLDEMFFSPAARGRAGDERDHPFAEQKRGQPSIVAATDSPLFGALPSASGQAHTVRDAHLPSIALPSAKDHSPAVPHPTRAPSQEAGTASSGIDGIRHRSSHSVAAGPILSGDGESELSEHSGVSQSAVSLSHARGVTCVTSTVPEALVTLTAVDGRAILARRVIVACSPHGRSRVRVRPSLPTGMSDAMRRLPPSSLVKTVLLYERRLWREHQGLSGHLVGLARDDVVTWTADISPSDAGPYAIAVFTCGESARRLERLSQDERCGIVSDALADSLSIPAMRYPLGHGDVAWAQVESVAGGPGIPGPGVLTSLGRDLTRRRAGPLHFATAEVAKRWPGTPEGSVEAGRRAAYETLEALVREDGVACEIPAVAPWEDVPEESSEVPDASAASRPQWQSYVPTPSQLVGMAAVVGMLVLAVACLKLYGTDSLLFKPLAV